MDRAYGANHLSRPSLRVIAGWSTARADTRLHSKRSLLRILRVTIMLLLLPVFILGTLLVAIALGGVPYLVRTGLPLLGLCAGMVGLAVALLARSLQRLRSPETRLGVQVDKRYADSRSRRRNPQLRD